MKDAAELSRRAAADLLDAIDRDPAVVLGLPTGNTPLGMYRRVVATCRHAPRCFRDVRTFNLDEYVGLPAEHPGSYRSYMRRHLFDHVDVRCENMSVPDGTAREVLRQAPDLPFEEALRRECARYEAAIQAVGGLDVTYLGLGQNGHIAFNEPGSPLGSRTRAVELAPSTCAANARHFPPGEPVPQRALTMGIGTILESRRLVVLAAGAAKAEAVTRLARGEVTDDFPASALHLHWDVTVLVDEAAAAATFRRPS
ncbi:MAG TPA: glucosamine-6-phosphate deaminase [Thermoanaerobaculia bacterium]|nr:glucosamine-6-phosphate deaminase [Thermoanaerobaculia bacterium]